MPLYAFHRNRDLREKYIARVKEHMDNDDIIRGVYWQGGKGDAIGVTVHSGNHGSFETELGIPHLVARIEERIFDCLPDPQYKQFPLQVLKSIELGTELKLIPYKFFAWLIAGSKVSLISNEKNQSRQADLNALAAYITVCTGRRPTDEEREKFKITERNLKANAAAKDNHPARAGHHIIQLFRDNRQAWNSDKAIEAAKIAYAGQEHILTSIEEFGTAMAEKFIDLLKNEI